MVQGKGKGKAAAPGPAPSGKVPKSPREGRPGSGKSTKSSKSGVERPDSRQTCWRCLTMLEMEGAILREGS